MFISKFTNMFTNKKMASLLALTTLMIWVVTFSSCDKKFDEPPAFEEPNITVTTTIAELKALHVNGQVESITTDLVIAGVVNADDRSGNYYKQISIQDSTGGITLRLDGNNLYANYPVGRKIYIKLKGLFMGDYNGLIQLGGSIDNSGTFLNVNAIASNLFDNYILKGSTGNVVTPKVVTVAGLNNSYQSMLIQIDNAEFLPSDTSKTYADNVGNLSVNLNAKSCTGSSIIVRTSGYANFAGIKAAKGNGALQAIYTVFGSTKQLVIRDTSDVKFYGARCNAGGGGGGGTGTRISIAQLRAQYTGTDILIGSYKIGGVVISDAANKNVTNGLVILQDGNAGISVYFGGTLTYNVGDSVILDVTGDSLINFRGSLEVKTPFGTTPPAASATGQVITPSVKTITELNTALSTALGAATNIEFTLVKIVGATATPAGTYSGNKTLTDAGGTLAMFTTSAATFSGATMPTVSTDWVGYTSKFNTTRQFQIRNTTDVAASGGGGGTGTTLLNENFESVTTTGTTPVALTGWTNLSELGTQKYLGKTFSSNKYAQITAFSSSQDNVTSWLVTKGVSLNATTGEVLTFDTKSGFNNGATLKVLISTNYTGTGNPWDAAVTWTDVTASVALSPGSTTGYATNFTPSGNIDLSTYTGTVYVAFKYEGADPAGTTTDKTTTWQIDNVKIVGN